MQVEELVQARLVADDELTNIVPPERIRSGADVRGLMMPYIVHRPIYDRINPQFGGGGRREVASYQVSVIAATYAAARAIADRIVAILDGAAADGAAILVTGRTWQVAREPEPYVHVAIELTGAS